MNNIVILERRGLFVCIETNNEGIFALIHKIWCKTQKQTTMPEEMFPQKIDHECDSCKKFHFCLGHETCLQTSLIKTTNFTCKNLEMQSFGLHKNY
jgi:hypothetical protein